MTNMEKAKEAIGDIFSDMSKEQEDTRADLVELKEEIESCIAAIDEF